MLGKNVKVIVDRPLGTHHPKYKDLYYSLNYGYVEGIISADGEEQEEKGGLSGAGGIAFHSLRPVRPAGSVCQRSYAGF